MKRPSNLLLVFAIAIAAFALILGSRQTAHDRESCIAAGGEPTYDHDGFRCMRDGSAIEVTP
jgi:hypothetical protein